MQIGEFAQVSGLTVKALRHYDERGLLRPAEVDPHSRYRSYAASQLRQAVAIRAMRDAGVPIDDLTDRLTAGSVDSPIDIASATALLDAQRTRRLVERDREDRADSEARNVLDALSRILSVEVRDAQRQPWVGVIMPVPVDAETEPTNDDANVAFGALWTALQEQGSAPTGAYWSTIRGAVGPNASPDTVELVVCWPLEEELPDGWTLPGHLTETGAIPEGREVSAGWLFADGPQTEDTTHPAVIALLETIEDRGLDVDLSQLRQRGILGPDGTPVGVELVYPLV